MKMEGCRSGIRIAGSLAAMLFLISDIAGAQTLSERERLIDSIAHPKVSETAALSMKFDSSVIGTGIIAEEAGPQSFSFFWTNIWSGPVTVTNVTTSCGCLIPSFDRMPVGPGEKSSLTVTYYPKGHPGPFEQRIFVYTDLSGTRPAVILSLMGDVQPAEVPTWNYRCRMGDLLLKRKEVRFRPGIRAVERILCQNAGDKPLTIGAETALLPPYITFRCEPETIAPGEKADLVISYNPEAAPARMLDAVPVILTGIPLPPAQRTVRAVFSEQRPEIRSTPMRGDERTLIEKN